MTVYLLQERVLCWKSPECHCQMRMNTDPYSFFYVYVSIKPLYLANCAPPICQFIYIYALLVACHIMIHSN